MTQFMLHVWTVPNPGGQFAMLLDRRAAATASDQSVADVGADQVVDLDALHAVVSDSLGLPPSAIRERFEAGHSVGAMADEQGIGRARLEEILLAHVRAELEAHVDAGDLTRQLRAVIQDFYDQQIPLLIDVTPDDVPNQIPEQRRHRVPVRPSGLPDPLIA